MNGIAGNHDRQPFCRAAWDSTELPVMDYRQVLGLQEKLVSARANRKLPRDILLLVQHFPVFTLGNRGGAEHLHVSGNFLKEQGIDLIETGRGGSITYHGPGQLVAYPIVDLAVSGMQATDFVRALEAVMISIVGQWGLAARGDAAARGAWIGDRKIGSLGLRVRRKVSFHGLALNVDPDLTPFSWITPCGLSGIQMTSIARETGGTVSMNEVIRAAKTHFSSVFNVRLEPVTGYCLTNYLKEEYRAETPA